MILDHLDGDDQLHHAGRRIRSALVHRKTTQTGRGMAVTPSVYPSRLRSRFWYNPRMYGFTIYTGSVRNGKSLGNRTWDAFWRRQPPGDHSRSCSTGVRASETACRRVPLRLREDRCLPAVLSPEREHAVVWLLFLGARSASAWRLDVARIWSLVFHETPVLKSD